MRGEEKNSSKKVNMYRNVLFFNALNIFIILKEVADGKKVPKKNFSRQQKNFENIPDETKFP